MGAVMEFQRNKRENQRVLGLDKGLRDATADYLRRRYPTNTAKMTARAFNLTLDQGRSAARGNPSLTVIETIIKTGGWQVALPILADVIGNTIMHHFRELRGRNEQYLEAFDSLAGDLWAVDPDRSFAADSVDHGQLDRRRGRARLVGGR